MTAQPLDEVRPSDDDSRLRPSEQLVSGEADEVGAGAETLRRSGLVSNAGKGPRSEIVHERQVVTPCQRRRDRQGRGRSVNPTTRKFDWCTRRRTAVSGPTARS